MKELLKLIEALDIIKKECDKHQTCDTCQLEGLRGCQLGASPPSNWDFNEGIQIWKGMV